MNINKSTIRNNRRSCIYLILNVLNRISYVWKLDTFNDKFIKRLADIIVC